MEDHIDGRGTRDSENHRLPRVRTPTLWHSNTFNDLSCFNGLWMDWDHHLLTIHVLGSSFADNTGALAPIGTLVAAARSM